jgi:hypothetical protein
MSGQQALTALEKKQLCQLAEDDPKLKYKGLIGDAQKQWKKAPSMSAISRMLKDKQQWLSLKDSQEN